MLHTLEAFKAHVISDPISTQVCALTLSVYGYFWHQAYIPKSETLSVFLVVCDSLYLHSLGNGKHTTLLSGFHYAKHLLKTKAKHYSATEL